MDKERLQEEKELLEEILGEQLSEEQLKALEEDGKGEKENE